MNRAHIIAAVFVAIVATPLACVDTDTTTGEGEGEGEGEDEGCTRTDVTDCAVLGAISSDFSVEDCEACQGLACADDVDNRCAARFACIDGAFLLRGCCDDDDCDDLDSAPYCGQYLGANGICVNADDV